MRLSATSMRVVMAVVVTIVAGCGAEEKMDGDARPRERGNQTVANAAAVAMAPRVVFVGTSLTAGHGLSADRAFPVIVSRLAAADDLPVRVINAGVSGETSAGALRRIDWVLREPADVYVLETGANDGLRALNVDSTRANITRLVRRIQRARPQARVLLMQMEAPPNFGLAYTLNFRRMYAAIARETGVTLVPFLLEGVAGDPTLNQADGLHPNIAGAARVAANVWRVLAPVVRELSRR